MKTYCVFAVVAFVVLYLLFGLKQMYVVGNRSEGMASTFPVLVFASLVGGAVLKMWFDKLMSRLKGPDRDETDK